MIASEVRRTTDAVEPAQDRLRPAARGGLPGSAHATRLGERRLVLRICALRAADKEFNWGRETSVRSASGCSARISGRALD